MDLQTKLRCPACRKGCLEATAEGDLRCLACGRRFPRKDGIPLLLADEALLRDALARDPGKHATGGEYHWNEYGIRDLLPSAEEHREVLLLGCGDGGERPFLHALGFEVAGFDIKPSSGTDFAADAHRIPLADASFDVVLSMQVLEHLPAPWVAVEEVGRILRPGGWFIGSVAFLKAYHGSYFHMTHEGVAVLLDRAGLEPVFFTGAQSLTYTLFGALVPIGSVGLRRRMLGTVDRMLHALRVAIWSKTRKLDPDEPSERFHGSVPMSFRDFEKARFAPAVVFKARKPHDRRGRQATKLHFESEGK